MKRFSDFAKEEAPFEGERLFLKDILEQEIEILGFRVRKSKYKKGGDVDKDYITIQFRLAGKTHICFTGSEVLKNQLEKYQSEIPFITQIIQVDRYFSLK